MEEEKIKISVVVPVYNVENYIRECLDSIVGQTYKNIEIILVDDGSTDSSGKICDEYARNDDRIIVVHKENGGQTSARKAGILLATGDYTTYVDSDDWIEANAYEELAKLVTLHYPDIIAFGVIKEYESFYIERRERLQKGLYDIDKFMQSAEKTISLNHFFCQALYFSACAKLFQTDMLRKHQLEMDETVRKGEDMAIVFSYVLNCNSILVEEQCFYHYRVRKGSVSWCKGTDEYSRLLNLVRYLKQVRTGYRKWNDSCEKYFVQILYFYLMYCACEHCFRDNRLVIFPEVKKDDNIVIYGKGVFACNLIEAIQNIKYCNVIACIDKIDAEKIKYFAGNSYDYVVIAITEPSAVQQSILLLEKMKVDRKKILYVKKENLSKDKLPLEIQEIIK